MYQNIVRQIYVMVQNTHTDAVFISSIYYADMKAQIYVPDNEFAIIKLMYKNAHCHQQRNVTGCLPSPVRESVTKYVTCQLTQGQIKNALSIDYPNIPLPSNQLINLINYTRRRTNPEIFSVYDFNQWCMNHNYDDNLLYSTFVAYYPIKNIDDILLQNS